MDIPESRLCWVQHLPWITHLVRYAEERNLHHGIWNHKWILLRDHLLAMKYSNK